MPPKRKPPHPISETSPRTQLNTVTSTQLEPILQPATVTQPTLATAPTETAPPLKRKHRGRTRGIGTSQIVKATHRKLEIIYEDADGRPTGPNASRFVSEIGCSVRIFAPLQKVFWKDVTEFEKSPIYDKVEVMRHFHEIQSKRVKTIMGITLSNLGQSNGSKVLGTKSKGDKLTGDQNLHLRGTYLNLLQCLAVFNVDYDKYATLKEFMEKSMATSFREFRYELHSHYKEYLDQPMAHRKANKPKEVRDQVDWDYLCDYWESEQFQKKSKIAVENRSQQQFTHFSGSRSFIQCQVMEDNGTGRPNRIQLWKNTHYKDNKGWIHPVAEEKYKEMIDMQTTQEAHVEGEESESQGVQLTANDIATQVLGTTSCYYRGLGRGPKVPRATSLAITTQRENAELRQVVHNLQSQNERILALLEEIMPGATARIGSPRVPTTLPSPS